MVFYLFGFVVHHVFTPIQAQNTLSFTISCRLFLSLYLKLTAQADHNPYSFVLAIFFIRLTNIPGIKVQVRHW